jgi:hypothetical protein
MATPPDFTAGQVLTAAQMNAVGLWLVKTQTLNATSVNITSCFTSDYDSYRVVISNLDKTTTTERSLFIRLLNNTTADTSANYGIAYNGSAPTDINLVFARASQSSWEIGLLSNRAGQSLIIDFNSPHKASASSMTFQLLSFQQSFGYIIRQGGGGHNVATAFNGFQIFTGTDTLSGEVRVYGYNQ